MHVYYCTAQQSFLFYFLLPSRCGKILIFVCIVPKSLTFGSCFFCNFKGMMQGPNGQAMNGPQMNMPMGAPNMMPGKYRFIFVVFSRLLTLEMC